MQLLRFKSQWKMLAPLLFLHRTSPLNIRIRVLHQTLNLAVLHLRTPFRQRLQDIPTSHHALVIARLQIHATVDGGVLPWDLEVLSSGH